MIGQAGSGSLFTLKVWVRFGNSVRVRFFENRFGFFPISNFNGSLRSRLHSSQKLVDVDVLLGYRLHTAIAEIEYDRYAQTSV